MDGNSDIRWGQLAEETRLAMRWAAAMEGKDVGTRTLLAGIIRAEGAESAPQQLLDAFGCPLEQLFDLLQAMAPRPPIDPYPSAPAALFGLPALSPNAALALDGAFGLRDRHHPRSELGTRHLFAAILDNPRCTAYRALAIVLEGKVELASVRNLFHEQLLSAGGTGFRARLHRLLPEAASSVGAAARGSARRELSGHVGPVQALAFATDGSSLASAGEDGLVRVWDLAGKTAPLVLDYHVSIAQSELAYTPDGQHLVCGNADGELLVWNLDDSSSEAPFILAGGEAAVAAFAFSEKGTMAVGDRSGRITTWSPAFAQLRDSIHYGAPSMPGLGALAFAPGGERLASGGTEGLAIWMPRTMEMVGRVELEESSPVLALAFPSEGAILAHDRGGRTWRWDPRGNGPEQVARHSAGSTAAVFAADGSHLAIALADGSVGFGPADGEKGWRTLGGAGAVRSLALSADGKLVASGGEDGEIRLWEADAKPSSAGSGAEWLSDRPTNADSFGRKRLAAALARRLERIGEGDDGSFLLHVDGPWGAGKSSLLSLLEEELEAGADGERGDWLVVHFDAWRQSRVGPPWWALLTSLREGLGQSRRLPGRLGLRGLELLKLLRGYLLSSLLSLVVVGAAVALFLLLGPAKSDVASLAQTISAVIAVATTIWLLARGAARALMWESASGAKLYEQAEQDPMRGLADHFAWLISQAGQKRVVFFVDDLDRCDEDYVVDLLESIQTLVRDAPQRAREGRRRGGRPPFFVVAADGRWIRRSYEHAYETFQDAVHEPGRRLGYLFLDKIFQLTLHIPEIGEEQRSQYLDELLRLPETDGSESAADGITAADGEAQIRQSRDQVEILRVVEGARPEARRRLEGVAVGRLNDAAVERATEHELQRFAPLLEPNPRSMKRFVNAYSVSLSTELLAGRLPDPEALALWMILRMRWPELAECLSASPQLVTAIAAGGEPPAGLPEALGPLCGDTALEALLAFGDGALGAEAIEALG